MKFQFVYLLWLLGKAAIVKLYDVPEGEIKLTDLLDIVGVISLDPAMALSEPNETSIFPPPSLVPRLHVVHFKKVSLGACNNGVNCIFFRKVMTNLTSKGNFFHSFWYFSQKLIYFHQFFGKKTLKLFRCGGKIFLRGSIFRENVHPWLVNHDIFKHHFFDNQLFQGEMISEEVINNLSGFFKALK